MSFFSVQLAFTTRQQVVEKIDIILVSKRDISFFQTKEKSVLNSVFLRESWLSPHHIMFLETFFSYNWNTDHREDMLSLRLFPPFETWFLQLLCQYSANPSYRYENIYAVWRGEICFHPFEVKNDTVGDLLVTSTMPLLLRGKQLYPLASPFSQEKLRDLFMYGKLSLDLESMDALLPCADVLKKCFDVLLPQIREVADVEVEIDLHELQDGFFEVVLWVVIGDQRFAFRYEEMYEAITHKQRILFHSPEGLWFVSLGSKGYEKIQYITQTTLECFSRFLGEVKHHTIVTHDMKTLFGRYTEAIAPYVTFIRPWKRVAFEKVVIDVVPSSSVDWLEVNFEIRVEGSALTREEWRHLVRYGYLKREGALFSLSSEEVTWLKEVEESWFLHHEEERIKLRPSHVFLLQDVVKKAPGNKRSILHLPFPYNELSFSGEILDCSIPIPETVVNVLRSYQKIGYWWLHFLYKYGFGGFLADEMGLGKTLQVIAFLLSIKGKGQGIIVCPSALLHNWAKEITKFAKEELYFLIMDGSPEKRREKQRQSEKYDLLITSYSLLHQDKEFYHSKIFHVCILDEAQHVKNKKAKRTQSLKALRAMHRIAITGTPIENTITEIWNIFDFLMPGFLGTHSWFSKNFEMPFQSPVATQREEACKRLQSIIKPFVLRRTKEEVLPELPPKIEQEVWLDLTESQKVLYVQTIEAIKAFCEKEFSHSPHQTVVHFLAGLTKLRQICLHPLLVGQVVEEEPIKLRALREIVLEALDSNHRIVIFSQFVELLQLAQNELEKMQLETLYLDGRTRNRVDLVETFNKGEIPLFLISTRAGGTGLTITGADTVILFDPWWNPSVEKQAVDRVHRLGQKRTVHVFRLLTVGTIEEKIFFLQKKKKALFQSLITNNTEFLSHLSWEDLRMLLEYNV